MLLCPMLASAASAVTDAAGNGAALPDAVSFLQDMAMVMIVAALVALVAHRLRQPVVLGYILAGLLLGPHMPGIALPVNEQSINTLSEMGIIFLMFSLGLHFSLKQLAKVGATAFTAATLSSLLMIWIGYEIGQLFGWKTLDSLFLGAILSISSTIIIIKILQDKRRDGEPFAIVIYGILIAQDIFAIALLAVLPVIATKGTLDFAAVAGTLGWLAVFLAAVLVVGLLAVPVLLRHVDRFNSAEMLLIAALGLLFGVSLLAARLEYSVALGAFLIGAIVAETPQRRRIDTLTAPLRDMFVAIFFVATGMLIDPALMIRHALPIAILAVLVVVAKTVTIAFGTFVAGNDPRRSLRAALGLVPIGEFSFVIAALGQQHGTDSFLLPATVAIATITAFLTPYLIDAADPLADWLDKHLPKKIQQPLWLYHIWVSSRHRPDAVRSQVRPLLWKWVLQMSLNVVLITGVLAVAAFFASPMIDVPANGGEPIITHRLPQVPHWPRGTTILLWLGAMIICLPLLVATLRKLRATGMLVAEVSVARSDAHEQTATIRAIITNTIVMTGSFILGLWMLILSSTMLASGWVLVVGVIVMVGVTMLAWRWCVKIYARGQVALRETLATEYEDDLVAESPAPTGLPSVLDRAVLETVDLPEESPFAGRAIRDIPLRSVEGGASIVAIDRGGEPIINPAADETVRPGDHVLLLGLPAQVAAARLLLTQGEVQVE